MARKIHIGLAVNETEKEMLDILAEQEERTASQIMRRALAEYFNNHNK